jgi:hypothetical protein
MRLAKNDLQTPGEKWLPQKKEESMIVPGKSKER